MGGEGQLSARCNYIGRDDDTHAIVDTIAHAAAVQGPATVFFPAGRTFLTKPFNITSWLTLEINGTVTWVTGNNTARGLDFVRGMACNLEGTRWAMF